MSKAILLSGGIDSISLAYWQKPSWAITIDYGQLAAETEIRVSQLIARELGMQHKVIRINCGSLGSGDLLKQDSIANSPSSEWWPFRNQLLATFALMFGVKVGISEIMVASVKSDGFHKDGTMDFYSKLSNLSSYQEGGILISAPAIQMNTVELVRSSEIPREILFWAHSCHTSNVACGKCRGCLKYHLTISELFYEK